MDSPLLKPEFMHAIHLKVCETFPRVTIEEIEGVIRALLWAQQILQEEIR